MSDREPTTDYPSIVFEYISALPWLQLFFLGAVLNLGIAVGLVADAIQPGAQPMRNHLAVGLLCCLLAVSEYRNPLGD